MTRLRIRQVRSGLGRPAGHRATLRALGLRRHQQTVEHADNPAIRGMIFKVRHLVAVEEIPGGEA
ncbi:MAG: 50S ribosomal protein L30 [Gemmatimonadota bacterium]